MSQKDTKCQLQSGVGGGRDRSPSPCYTPFFHSSCNPLPRSGLRYPSQTINSLLLQWTRAVQLLAQTQIIQFYVTFTSSRKTPTQQRQDPIIPPPPPPVFRDRPNFLILSKLSERGSRRPIGEFLF